MEKREIKKLEKWGRNILRDDFDKFDFLSEMDNKLSLSENKTMLREKFKVFLNEIKPTAEEIKTEKQKEEFEEMKKIKEQEQKAEKEFQITLTKLKQKDISIIDKYKIPTEYIKSVASGFNNAFIFLGSQGLGKSYLTRQILAKSKTDFVESRGVNSPLALYNFIYDYNDKNKVLVFDDVASLVNNDNAFCILLGVLWDRIVSWNSTTAKLKIPKQFLFNGRVIIICNKLDGEKAEIVKSRCLTYNLEMTREEKLEMMYLIAKQKADLSLDERNKIVDFIKKNTDKSSCFDLRTQNKIEQLYLYDKQNWKSLAKPLLVKNNEIEILLSCLNNFDTIRQAEKSFVELSGLSRATFYRLKKSLSF